MKLRIEKNEQLDVTLPSGKVISITSFTDPHDDAERDIVECVTASHRGRVADARLNNYLWANVWRPRNKEK